MEKILPAIDQFKPEFIIISAGFDAHADDPLGEINLSTGFYGWDDGPNNGNGGQTRRRTHCLSAGRRL